MNIEHNMTMWKNITELGRIISEQIDLLEWVRSQLAFELEELRTLKTQVNLFDKPQPV